MLKNVYLRLRGMNLLMRYVGCVGSLLAGSSIVEVFGTFQKSFKHDKI